MVDVCAGCQEKAFHFILESQVMLREEAFEDEAMQMLLARQTDLHIRLAMRAGCAAE